MEWTNFIVSSSLRRKMEGVPTWAISDEELGASLILGLPFGLPGIAVQGAHTQATSRVQKRKRPSDSRGMVHAPFKMHRWRCACSVDVHPVLYLVCVC